MIAMYLTEGSLFCWWDHGTNQCL